MCPKDHTNILPFQRAPGNLASLVDANDKLDPSTRVDHSYVTLGRHLQAGSKTKIERRGRLWFLDAAPV